MVKFRKCPSHGNSARLKKLNKTWSLNITNKSNIVFIQSLLFYLIMVNFHCVSFWRLSVIVCHYPLSISSCVVSFNIACHSPLYVIHYWLSFTIVCYSPLAVIHHCLSFHCLSFTLSVIPFVCHSPWYVIPHCLSFPMSNIHHCLLASIICHHPIVMSFLIINKF